MKLMTPVLTQSGVLYATPDDLRQLLDDGESLRVTTCGAIGPKHEPFKYICRCQRECTDGHTVSLHGLTVRIVENDYVDVPNAELPDFARG